MNFLAIIGVVDQLKKITNSAYELLVRVEKPNYINNENWFEILPIMMNIQVIGNIINSLTIGATVGIKGRVSNVDNITKVIGERIELF